MQLSEAHSALHTLLAFLKPKLSQADDLRTVDRLVGIIQERISNVNNNMA
jgi:hypothetical protein